jgi:hypothetical protein
MKDKLICLSGTNENDIILAGDDRFRQESTTSTQNKFETKPIDSTPLTFTGIKIGGTPSCRKMSQERYIGSLSLLSKDADFESFRSMRAKLSWASNSRPDIACAVAFAAQVLPTTFTKDAYKLLNKDIKYLKMIKGIQLQNRSWNWRPYIWQHILTLPSTTTKTIRVR